MAIFGLGDDIKKPEPTKNNKTNSKADEKENIRKKIKAKEETGGCEFC